MDLVCVTVDCADPAAMAAFWSEALYWRDVRVASDGTRAVCRSPLGRGYLEFVRVPDRTTDRRLLTVVDCPYADPVLGSGHEARFCRMVASASEVRRASDATYIARPGWVESRSLRG